MEACVVVFEAPLAPSFARGHTNANTIRKLMGLVAVIGGTAHRLGFYNIAEAAVADIRGHFLGVRRMRSKEAEGGHNSPMPGARPCPAQRQRGRRGGPLGVRRASPRRAAGTQFETKRVKLHTNRRNRANEGN